MNRNQWKSAHRALRIMDREAKKAAEDLMLFGTSFTRYGDQGAWQRDGSDVVQRVDPSSVFITAAPRA